MAVTATSTERLARSARTVRLVSVLLVAAGAVMLIAGAATWLTVQSQLADEKITVSEDAARFGGEPVDGPFTAYEQAKVIERHALETSEGKTYAELAGKIPAGPPS